MSEYPRLEELPGLLSARVRHMLAEWTQAPLPARVADSLPLVWATSSYAARVCLRYPGLLTGLGDSGHLERRYAPGELGDLLGADAQAAADLEALIQALRIRRHRELLRIAWRDLAGWADLEETLGELSDLADACIEAALQWIERDFSARHGVIRAGDSRPARLVVLGMGKLGGHELNFSSDIDLIFAYDGSGDSDGSQSLDHEAYFTRLTQLLVRVLAEATADGFVYRVDTLLRPFGKSGPLVMHVDAMEQYYQSHGREWERYALIKARPVAGDRSGGERLLSALRPFIYRRYLDFGAFESLRTMKDLIERQLHRNGYKDNIKLGAGGIREVEFIVQAFQLIRGGRVRALQQRSLMPVLDVLEREALLPDYAARVLREAYIFLRRTENRLQAWQDQQTHELPPDDERRQALAFAMGHPDWSAFHRELERHRSRVHQQFEQVFAAPHAQDPAQAQLEKIAALWEDSIDDTEALRVLAEQGLSHATATLEFLRQLRRSSVYRSLGEQGRKRFSQLLPLLFGAVRDREHPETALVRVLQVIEAVAGRTTYLALLVENPMALSQLVALCAASPWITGQIRQHPLLLDELLDPRTLYRPASRQEMERELASSAEAIAPDDLEGQMDLLRRLKQSWVLRVAAADIGGAMPLMIVSDHLTDIAEIIVRHALQLAWRQMVSRHGRPLREDGREAGFAVIAFGKLGGIELGYGSDLDLVFVHDGVEGLQTGGERPLDHGAFFTRLGQKIIHVLSAQMPSGVAYAVDMRLRPSGNSGLLVTGLEGYRAYQAEKAWTWEHQALVRARPIAGDPALAEAFRGVRRDTLCQVRDVDKLKLDIASMRRKMRDGLEKKTAGTFDLKHGIGGVIDIEFLVQWHILRWAQQCPALVAYTDNIRQLEALAANGFLPPVTATRLADAYRSYRKRLHALDLAEAPRLVDDQEFRGERELVAQLWGTIFSGVREDAPLQGR